MRVEILVPAATLLGVSISVLGVAMVFAIG